MELGIELFAKEGRLEGRMVEEQQERSQLSGCMAEKNQKKCGVEEGV